MTVRQLLDQIDSAEFSEWLAFDSMEPIGDRGAYMRSAVQTAVTGNAGFSTPKTPFRPQDFMPDRKEDEPMLLADPEQQAALIRRKIFGVTGV